MKSGDSRQWSGFCQPLDVGNETEETLRRENAFLQELIESVPDGILIVSPDGKLLYFNHRFLEIWQIPAHVIETRSDQEALEWAAQQAADPKGFLAGVAAVYADRNHPPSQEELLMKDGRVLDRFGAPVRRDGVHYGWLWTFRDITSRKKAEEALKQSEQQLLRLSQSLEERVEERTHALEEKTIALQEQTARLRELAAQLASAEQRERKRLAALLHDDLQQLLAAANMRLSSVSRRAHDTRDREEILQAAEWLGKAVTAARELTHELRPPALYEDGLVPALYWLTSRMLKRHQLRVGIHSDETLPPLNDDCSALLFDCVRELLFNVVKHANVKQATVSVHADDHWFRVIVEDQGKGFDPRLEVKEKGREGFGLFSIRERVLGLGGSMDIQSSVGAGARIELELPLSVVSAREYPAMTDLATGFPSSRMEPHPPPRLRPAGICVFLVDDHALVRQGIANVLSSDESIEVVGEAADGLEALEAMERACPDVAVVDLNMPRMNGIALTREIRTRWPDVAVVGLSVQDDEATRRSFLSAGADAFLAKSGEASQMIDVIRGLQQRRQRT